MIDWTSLVFVSESVSMDQSGYWRLRTLGAHEHDPARDKWIGKEQVHASQPPEITGIHQLSMQPVALMIGP
jgi:hypothetical protein